VASEEPLLDVAAALADGTAVDWESAAEVLTNDEDRRLLAELRFIAGMAPSTPGELSGRSWGPLRIIEHIGHGTFGDVYRAWDSRLDREVALKILRRKEREDQARASTVIDEGRLLARVRHPNVVTVYGAERIAGQVGVWMEFVHGKTLEQELRDRGPFDVDRVVRIGIELSGALSTVHRAGLIHRDVKAQNVLCDRDGRLVLTDFGAGCELQETVEGASRELAGTPASVAPEVLGGQAATPQSDVYSLGVLLYHLVTGTYPVRGRSLKEIREAHALGARTPLAVARPDLPSAFVRTVDRALDPNPQNRYDSPGALGSELASLVSRRKWKYSAIAATLALTAGFGAIALWWTPETRRYNTNPEAYELYLKASALVDPHSGAAMQQSIKLFEQVIARDPTFAPAYAGLVDAWATLSIGQYGAAADEAYARMRPAADKAVQLDPLLAEAHAATGIVLARNREWAESEAAFGRALARNRNLSSIRIAFAMNTLFPQGKLKDALQQLQEAVSRDPLPNDARRHLVTVLVSAGRYDEAIDECQRVLAADPDDKHTRQVMGRALLHKGQTAEAIAIFEKLGDGSHHFRGYAYAVTGRRAEAEALLAQPPHHPARLVIISAGLRDKDRTFEALERMAAEKDPRVGWYITHPELAFIREDPRMAAFRRKLGIPGS
jgi:tetratricopeptide (TPR) repeat protein